MTDDQTPSVAPPNTFDGLPLAKALLRQALSAALATLTAENFPFASLTTIAADSDGAPIILTSALAHHSRNLRRDPRASLLISEGGKGDPLAHPRLTLVGRFAAPVNPARARARFLRRQPKAALYVDFPDFSFQRLEIESAHINGGFARAANFAGAELLTPLDGAQRLIDDEAALIDEFNAAPRPWCGKWAQAAGGDPALNWRVSGLDPDGVDLLAPQAAVRLGFSVRTPDPDQIRDQLSQLGRD